MSTKEALVYRIMTEETEVYPTLEAAKAAGEASKKLYTIVCQQPSPIVAVTEGQQLLHMVQHSDWYDLRAALVAGSNPNTVDEKGTPLLHLATRRGDTMTMKVLLGNGAIGNVANVNGRDAQEQTALHIACSEIPHPTAIIELLAAGADVNARNQNGVTPLMYLALLDCINHRIVEAMELLLTACADINAVSHEGCTALHYAVAAATGTPMICRYLLEAGANVTEGSINVLDLCRTRTKNSTIYDLLLEYKAKTRVAKGVAALTKAVATLALRPGWQFLSIMIGCRAGGVCDVTVFSTDNAQTAFSDVMKFYKTLVSLQVVRVTIKTVEGQIHHIGITNPDEFY